MSSFFESPESNEALPDWLDELRPTSATELMPKVFYQAGYQAARQEFFTTLRRGVAFAGAAIIVIGVAGGTMLYQFGSQQRQQITSSPQAETAPSKTSIAVGGPGSVVPSKQSELSDPAGANDGTPLPSPTSAVLATWWQSGLQHAIAAWTPHRPRWAGREPTALSSDPWSMLEDVHQQPTRLTSSAKRAAIPKRSSTSTAPTLFGPSRDPRVDSLLKELL